MRTCVELKGSISVAHRAKFSPQWAAVHGHDYVITVGICRDSYTELVVDADEAAKRLKEILQRMDGKYLASSSETTSLPQEEVYVVPCNLPGASGECIVRHVAELVGASWARICESSLQGPCFYVEIR